MPDAVRQAAERIRGERIDDVHADNTKGTSASGKPPSAARSTRNASLKRANVNTAPIVTTHQYARDSLRKLSRRIGLIGRAALRVPVRARRRQAMRPRAPGITATQKTARKSLAHSINPSASSGPINAPTVSSDCLSQTMRRALCSELRRPPAHRAAHRECPCRYDR